jgi:hypothetical protein
MTDKVLVGNKTSWAVVVALGEVSSHNTTIRSMPELIQLCSGQCGSAQITDRGR